ncbi:MAG: hypothetical protein AAF433_12255 [Bacteroidota bacterium]
MYRLLLLVVPLFVFLTCTPAGPTEAPAPPPPASAGETISAEEFELSSIEGSELQLAVRKNAGGKLLEQGRVDASLVKQGDWTIYQSASDMPAKVSNYLDGHLNGISLDIDVHGRVTTVYNYLNNVLHGPYLQYKITHPELVANYHHGDLHGWYREYDYRNGNLKKEVLYEYGQMNGPFRQFNDDGSLLIEYNYHNGELVE